MAVAEYGCGKSPTPKLLLLILLHKCNLDHERYMPTTTRVSLSRPVPRG